MKPRLGRFPLVSVDAAGDGRYVKALRITCGTCGHTNDLLVKTRTPMPPEQAAQHFAKRGWVIGRNAGFDLCPSCVAAEVDARQKLKKEDHMPKPSLADQLKAAVLPPPAIVGEVSPEVVLPLARSISRADRRRIMDFLDRVYPDPEKGYAAGYSDKRVGDEMDLPRAWVTQVREDSYGPEFVIDWSQIEKRQRELDERIRTECESMLSRFADLERQAASTKAEIEKLKKACGK